MPLDTLSKNAFTLIEDLRNKPPNEAFNTREAQELGRFIYTTAAVLLVFGASLDADDKSFIGRLKYTLHREAMTLMQSLGPALWLSIPRVASFLYDLGRNLQSLFLLETYKTKPGLKGLEGLKRQITPAPIRHLQQPFTENEARQRR